MTLDFTLKAEVPRSSEALKASRGKQVAQGCRPRRLDFSLLQSGVNVGPLPKDPRLVLQVRNFLHTQNESTLGIAACSS